MKNTKMLEILKEERAKFDDVSNLEAVRKAVILTLEDTMKEIEEVVTGFASTMTLLDLGVMGLTDDVRASIIASMVKGALAGAVANEIKNQIKEIDAVIGFNKGTLEKSKVVDFAEKKAEKEEKAETGTDDAMGELVTSLIMGALMEAMKDSKKETDGEA